MRSVLGGRLKTGNLSTGQNRQLSPAAESSEFYFAASSVRKSAWTLVRQLRGPHLLIGWPSVTRDDRYVVFTSSSSGVQSLWMISIDGGTPTQVTSKFAVAPSLSPDGKAVAFRSREQNHPVWMICDLPECSSPRSLSLPAAADVTPKWTPDGHGIAFVRGTPGNLWVQPLDGAPAQQLTHFTDDRPISDIA